MTNTDRRLDYYFRHHPQHLKRALVLNGVQSDYQFSRLVDDKTDSQLAALPGVGPKTLVYFRQARDHIALRRRLRDDRERRLDEKWARIAGWVK